MLRDASSLRDAAVVVAGVRAAAEHEGGGSRADWADWEVANLCEVAAAVVHAAGSREESRGAHNRADFPKTVPANEVRLVVG